MSNITCRLIHECGTRVTYRRHWSGSCAGKESYHNAELPMTDLPLGSDRLISSDPEDYPEDRWPTQCDRCQMPAPVDAAKQIFRRRLYNTTSGKPEPGDMYYAPWYHGEHRLCPWDHCDDPRGHLIVVLPNGSTWDLNSRAKNCTMKEDKLHRCWVLSGEAPKISAGKNGYTCGAGAGSIAVPGYHGFLTNGELREC